MQLAMLLLLFCPGAQPFTLHAPGLVHPLLGGGWQSSIQMQQSRRAAPPQWSNPNAKPARRANLRRGIEALPIPRQPDGPAEDDPFTPWALVAAQAGDDRKAQEIVALRVGHLTSVANFFVNMQASSRAQIEAIVKNVEGEMLHKFDKVGSRQGKATGGWVCIDYDGIVVNVFSREERDFYKMESLFVGAQRLDLSNVISPSKPAEKAAAAEDAGDDWDLAAGADDWSLGSSDEWGVQAAAGAGDAAATSGGGATDGWSLVADAWSLGDDEWSLGDAVGEAAGAQASGATAFELRVQEEAGVEEEEEDDEAKEADWALGDDSLRVGTCLSNLQPFAGDALLPPTCLRSRAYMHPALLPPARLPACQHGAERPQACQPPTPTPPHPPPPPPRALATRLCSAPRPYSAGAGRRRPGRGRGRGRARRTRRRQRRRQPGGVAADRQREGPLTRPCP